jgi:CheY-like chemotaxis protein
VAKTLLAVDDSVTMRKVLEITFSGEDFRVVTADSSQSALAKLSENPQVCVVDTVLGSEDGYALAKELRKRNPGAAIVLLASRYAPYDQARGREAGADDWADKPFDTQQLIDKVRKAMLAKEAAGATAAAAAVPAPAPAPTPAPTPAPGPAVPRAAQPAAAAASPIGRGAQPSAGGAGGRTGTLLFGENAPAAPPVAPRPAAGASAAAPPAPAPAPAPAAAQQVSGAVNGQLAGKLGDLGLTPQQAEAVLALSREVVERVVWEVVPQLAEAIIKEEIARLTKE